MNTDPPGAWSVCTNASPHCPYSPEGRAVEVSGLEREVGWAAENPLQEEMRRWQETGHV